jgi:hypothetical protein
MLLMFALTLFTSAFLLFLVQPMVGKLITPLLGGTPAVWNTCMVFFQALLLAGYAYSHATSTWLGARKQAVLHLCVLLIPFAFFPLAVDRSNATGADRDPVLTVLVLLMFSVGVPFLVVSTSAPLLQKWFASIDHPAARDPYFLYGASNLGSMLALLAYPTIVEPRLHLAEQRWLWCVGYGLLVGLTAVCAVCLWRSPPALKSPGESFPAGLESTAGRITTRRRLRWVILAAVPSSLLLGVTTYMTTDIAAIPLLWILPLALYLLSFILVFSRFSRTVQAFVHRVFVLTLPPLILLLLFSTVSSELGPKNLVFTIALHLGTFFSVAMVCHGELSLDRPAPRDLTEFFLWTSVGGVTGGLLNALIAPLLFKAIVEYQLAMVVACFLVPRSSAPVNYPCWKWTVDFLLLGLSVLIGGLLLGLRLGDRDLDMTPLSGQTGLFMITALLCGAGIGLRSILHAKQRSAADYLDLALPLALALLVVGLYWGLAARTVRPRVLAMASYLHARETWLRDGLVFGVPAALCCAFVKRPIRFGLGAGALALAAGVCDQVARPAAYQERSFFGVLRVEKGQTAVPGGRVVATVSLMHGSTLHGMQFRDADPAIDWSWRHQPLLYYHRLGPVGRVFEAYSADPSRPVGIIGLGAGAIAAYGLTGQRMTFYEIDPVVRAISFDDDRYFTYIRDACLRGVSIDLVQGDARLTLERRQLSDANKYGLLFVDAFSSDAIPIHLITREALQLYLDRVRPDGLVLFHVTNRYLELTPVLANLAADRGLVACFCTDQGDALLGKAPSTWVALARREQDVAYLKALSGEQLRLVSKPATSEASGRHTAKPWQDLAPTAAAGVWTDDYSNLLSVFQWR